RFAVPAELAVRPDGVLCGLFSLARGVFECLDSLVDFLELLRAVVERRQAPGDLVEPCGDGRGVVGHLLERLAERRELRASRGERREHGADGAALLTCRRAELVEGLRLVLRGFAAPERLESVEHDLIPALMKKLGPVGIATIGGCRLFHELAAYYMSDSWAETAICSVNSLKMRRSKGAPLLAATATLHAGAPA